MVEELEASTPPAPRLTLAEVGDIAATWAVLGAVTVFLWGCAVADGAREWWLEGRC
jgi:hypothetical protein